MYDIDHSLKSKLSDINDGYYQYSLEDADVELVRHYVDEITNS